jgi:adenosylcobinamide amidohydrolase
VNALSTLNKNTRTDYQINIRGIYPQMTAPLQQGITAKWVIEIELPESYSHTEAHDVLDRIKDSCAIKREMRVALTVKHTDYWTVKP